MDLPRELLTRQDGVVSRAQLLADGLGESDLRRLLRRRELVAVHPGVYVEHTGPPTWRQLAWAATLVATPAVLSHGSALRAHGVRGHERPAAVDVAVGRHRSPRAPVGVRVHRRAGIESRALWHLGPPRDRVEHAALDVASEAATTAALVAALGDVVGAGRSTPARLRAALEARPRLPGRPLVSEVLDEVDAGVRSPLERRYRRDVELAHGLPPSERQVRSVSGGAVVVRDALYRRFGVVVELDGRLGHADPEGRGRDMTRDLWGAVDGLTTLRLGWVQVTDEACATPYAVAAVLRRGGWAGQPHACPSCRDSPSITVAQWQ